MKLLKKACLNPVWSQRNKIYKFTAVPERFMGERRNKRSWKTPTGDVVKEVQTKKLFLSLVQVVLERVFVLNVLHMSWAYQ